MKYTCLLFFSVLLGFLCFAVEAAGKPNVILIMADDVSWEAFGCYGAEDYQTPHIDSLAANGIRFDHCYSTPICTTSRVQIMTGTYNFRNYTHFGYLDPSEQTFGYLMQQAGYKTAIAGKWQLNGLYNSIPGHDDPTRPQQAGFDESLLWQVTTTKNDKNGGERFWSPPLEHNGRFVSAEENQYKYGPDLLCEFVCDFIQRHQDEPFFVYYPMVLVHDPFIPTPDTIGDASRGPSANKSQKGKEKENFIAMVNYMDKIVGRIVAQVEAIDQLDNTIILFTADNGTNTRITSGWNGMQIKGGKGGMTDMGTHVPLVVSWHGHTPHGTVCSDLINFPDFYQTLVDLNTMEPRLTAAKNYDGRSFLPQLTGKTGSPRSWAFCHYQPYWNKQPGQFARTQSYKLYRDGRFYNVPQDLREQTEIALDSAPAKGEADRKMLAALLETSPPAPTGKGSRETIRRPIYPDWKQIGDPND
jgi:arylsulfatase A